jgi:putative redox protein
MVQATLKEKLSVSIRARGHEIVADGPALMNGLDLGMNPHELVEAALAACTAMTVQLYAQRKQWKLQSVNVGAQIVSEGPETLIREDLNVVGELSQEQRHRLFEIACRCPIHRLLRSHVTIDTNYLGPQKEMVWTHR